MTDANPVNEDFQRRFCGPLTEPPTWGRDRDLQRIADLEATVARLTAPVERAEATEAWNAWRMVEHPDEGMTSVLTAFLERRMKG